MTLLESREKCEIKLTKPLKFLTGRRDCIKVPHPTDPKNDTFLDFIGKDFITYKKEVRKLPKLLDLVISTQIYILIFRINQNYLVMASIWLIMEKM